MTVAIYNAIPAGFLEADPQNLIHVLPGPCLIELKGEKNPPLFISTLLHGNETSGIYALQNFLKKHSITNKILPRSLILFIGNVYAASEGKRTLENQRDFNRIWKGGKHHEGELAEFVINYARSQPLFACIDIHNNTGWNPYYTCINSLTTNFLHLAKMFSRRVVYFLRPEEVLSFAFKDFTTAIIVEAGQAGDVAGILRLVGFLEEVCALESIPDIPISNNDLDVYHSICRIHVPVHASISFQDVLDNTADFKFVANFESLNFMELPENSLLGWYKNTKYKLIITDENNQEIGDEFLTYANHEIRTKRPIIPSMFCTSESIIRQDCLGYFMQRYQLS